jgi:hypothetical protein
LDGNGRINAAPTTDASASEMRYGRSMIMPRVNNEDQDADDEMQHCLLYLEA